MLKSFYFHDFCVDISEIRFHCKNLGITVVIRLV